MKLLKKYVLLLSMVSLCGSLLAQQNNLKLTLNYVAGVPAGNFKNAVSILSPRGFEASILYGITDQFSLGGQGGFQDFYQRKPRQVIHSSGSDLSAVITNSIQVMPIMVKGKYILSNKSIVQPYAAMAAGVNFISYKKYYGQFADSRSKIGFAAQPELGVQMAVGAARRFSFNLSAGYNYMPFKYEEVNGLNNLALKAGFILPLDR